LHVCAPDQEAWLDLRTVAMFEMMHVLIFVRNLDMIPSLQVDFCRKTDE